MTEADEQVLSESNAFGRRSRGPRAEPLSSDGLVLVADRIYVRSMLRRPTSAHDR